MPWTVGSVHVLDGDGEVAIAKPVALAIVVDNVPAAAGVRDGTPPTYWGLGHLSLGTTSGFLEDVRVVHDSQLHLVEAREFTRLGYTLQPGVEITVTELLGSNTPTSSPMPFDRNMAPVVLNAEANPAPSGGTTTMFSYTVPSGRKLWLADARVSARRWQVATTATYWSMRITSPGLGVLVLAYLTGNVAGDEARDQLGSPIILGAGVVLNAEYFTGDTGGVAFLLARASGYTFDA